MEELSSGNSVAFDEVLDDVLDDEELVEVLDDELDCLLDEELDGVLDDELGKALVVALVPLPIE